MSSVAPPSGERTRVASRRLVVRPAWYRDRTGWILAASGTALVATAALLFVSARRLEEDALTEPSERKRLATRDSADGRRLASYLVGSSGLVVLGAGAIKLSIVRDEVGATSVSVAGRF